MNKCKYFESRTADGLEKAVNEFGEEHNIVQISYHRREPVVSTNTVTVANQMVHCCMVLYNDAAADVYSGTQSYGFDVPEADDGLMGLDTGI